MRSRAFQAVGVVASLVALCSMLGGHWLALQSVAWTRMLVNFSETGSFGDAVGKTFDGEHPCRMCLTIREGRDEEQRESRELPLNTREKSPELYCEVRSVFLFSAPGTLIGVLPTFRQSASDFIEAPPTPPPRRA